MGSDFLTRKPHIVRGELKGVLMAIRRNSFVICGSGPAPALIFEITDSGRLNESWAVSGVEVEHSYVSDVIPGAAGDLHCCSRPRGFHRQYSRKARRSFSNVPDKDMKAHRKFGVSAGSHAMRSRVAPTCCVSRTQLNA